MVFIYGKMNVVLACNLGCWWAKACIMFEINQLKSWTSNNHSAHLQPFVHHGGTTGETCNCPWSYHNIIFYLFISLMIFNVSFCESAFFCDTQAQGSRA